MFLNIVSLLLLFAFCFYRMQLLFLFFQQKEYRNNWFLTFIIEDRKLVDTKLTGCLIIFTFMKGGLFFSLLAFLLFVLYEKNVLRKAKKKLVITSRVKRIYGIALFFTALIIYFGRANFFIASVISIQSLPFLLLLSNFLLSPYEKKVQDGFAKQALEKLHKINPIVIGITGSMGKTSTKHILSHILSGNLPVIFTPGSVNTKMGITAFINNKLTECKYFVVEMGAYFKGSIKILCDFVEPKHGIITAIGDCHYEYFKSKEIVASAKFELAEEVAKHNGIMLINQNEIEEKLIPLDIPSEKIGKIEDIKQTKEGLNFKYNGNPVFAPIFGEHQATNIALAIEMATKLGMPLPNVLSTLKTLQQVNHRLEVSKKENGVTIIDDAYNSNFEGFKSGLHLLNTLVEGTKGRKILVTPGMVELGQIHDERHYEIGKIAGQIVDAVVLVNSGRVPTFIKGFDETKNNKNVLIEVATFADAQKWMDKFLKAEDVVLLENDLPDVYENNMKL